MKHKLKQASSLSLQDWGIFIEAWLTLSWVDFAVSHLPYHRWKSWLSSPPENSATNSSDTDRDLSHLVWLLDAAANNHPTKPTCLRRSLTLKKMLERRNTITTLRIGVNKDSQEVKAHAWIEYNGHAVNDASDIIAHYSPLPTLNADLLQKL